MGDPNHPLPDTPEPPPTPPVEPQEPPVQEPHRTPPLTALRRVVLHIR